MVNRKGQFGSDGYPPQGRPCHCCSLPDDKRREVLARTLLGHQWNDIAENLGCSSVAVLNHAKHVHERSSPEDYEWVREWSARTILSPNKQLDKVSKTLDTLETKDIEPLTQEVMTLKLLGLEKYALRLLIRMEEDSDFRGGIQAVEALRRLCESLSALHSLKKDSAEPVESEDTKVLREQIEATLARKLGR